MLDGMTRQLVDGDNRSPRAYDDPSSNDEHSTHESLSLDIGDGEKGKV